MVKVEELLAAALIELDARTAPTAERPTPVIKAAVEALVSPGPATDKADRG